MIAKAFLLALVGLACLDSISASPFKKRRIPPTELVLSDPKNEVPPTELVLSDSKNKESNGFAKREPYDKLYRWRDATVPYEEGVADDDALKAAIEEIQAKTCVKFRPKTSSDSNYVKFVSSKGCNSKVGCAYGECGKVEINLSPNCRKKKGKILHELMHVLGFLHEMSRNDRNQYVTIHEQAIKPGMESNFQKVDGVNQGISFDCDSVLMYKGEAFSKGNGQTISANNNYCTKLGNGDKRLSGLDFRRINKFYECKGYPETFMFLPPVTVKTSNRWFAGTDCEVFMNVKDGSLTDEVQLDIEETGKQDLFEGNSEETFKELIVRADMGKITEITLHLEHCKGYSPDWKPYWIKVGGTTFNLDGADLDPGKKYTFRA